LGNQGIDETVLRCRGFYGTFPNAFTADSLNSGAWGMIVVTDLAVAAGAASIPGPVTDGSDDGWFVWQPILSRLEFVTGAGIEANSATVKEFDSKAKRITETGQTIAVMVENASASTAFEFTLNMRILSMVRGTG